MAADPPRLRFSAPYRVRFDEADGTGALRASAHLRYMQDVAWQHSISVGFDMAWYASQDRFWLVRFVELQVLSPVLYGAEVAVSTEVVVMRRVWARRVSEFRLPGGALAAAARIDWIMTDSDGRPARIPGAMAAAFPLPGSSQAPGRLELPRPTGGMRAGGPAAEAAIDVVVRRSEIDPMRHMNNAAYVDHLEEVVAAAGGSALLESCPRRYGLEFLLPALPGARLTGRAWPVPGGWGYLLAGEDGAAQFRGVVDRPGGRST
jgi:acyl-CoA thioester hydrolase